MGLCGAGCEERQAGVASRPQGVDAAGLRWRRHRRARGGLRVLGRLFGMSRGPRDPLQCVTHSVCDSCGTIMGQAGCRPAAIPSVRPGPQQRAKFINHSAVPFPVRLRLR